MPVWDFKCETCGAVHEVFFVTRGRPADGTVCCPTCERPMEQLPSRTAFVLKGAGFYKNDYK